MNSLIGDRIKILRLRANLTQEKLALRLKLNSKSSIANYESGKISPSDSVKLQLCKVFHCSMDYLMGLTSDIEGTETFIDKKQIKLEQILNLVNGLTIQETNYLIKRLNNSKIQIEKGE